jgi:phage terminase large subunit
MAEKKKTKKADYVPFDKQRQFHTSKKLYRFFGWAMGGGKSKAERMEAVRLSQRKPNLVIWLFRRTFPELEAAIIMPLLAELPKDVYVYNSSKHQMTFKNGSRIIFWHVNNDKDVFKYQGAEFDAIGIDELQHFKEQQFDFLMTRLRTSKKGWTPCFFGTGNPGWIGHGWIKRRWVERDFRPGEQGDEYEYIASTLYDNPALLENDPNYVKRLETLDEQQKKAYLYGDWDIFDGQYYTEWNPNIHIIKPFKIPYEWKKVRALDYWYSNPSSIVWLAEDPTDGTVYVYRNVNKTKLLYQNLCDELLNNSPDDEIYVWTAADPALRAKTAATGETFFDIAERNKINIIPGDNDRLSGAQLVRSLLTPYETPHENGAKAGIHIFENCTSLIKSLPSLQFDKLRVEDVDTNGNDHDFDALKYGLKLLKNAPAELKQVAELNDKAKRKDRALINFRF